MKPGVFYILGGGRAATFARRTHKIQGRVVHIGDLIIRPQRRAEVTIGFVRTHAKLITSLIESGCIVLQHDADNFVDPKELASILELPTMAPDSGDEGKSQGETGDGDEAGDKDDAGEAGDEAVGDEPQDPGSEPEPTSETLPEATDYEEPTPGALPEAWEKSPKRVLQELCAARSVEVLPDATNRELVKALKEWEEANTGYQAD